MGVFYQDYGFRYLMNIRIRKSRLEKDAKSTIDGCEKNNIIWTHTCLRRKQR